MVEKISTTKLKDYLKTIIECGNWYTGKIEDNQEKAIALYANRRQIASISKFKHLQSYGIVPITLLIKWGKNYNFAEKKAYEVFGLLERRAFELDNKNCFIECLYEGPIDLGSDDNGNFKFSIEFNLYVRKGEK